MSEHRERSRPTAGILMQLTRETRVMRATISMDAMEGYLKEGKFKFDKNLKGYAIALINSSI